MAIWTLRSQGLKRTAKITNIPQKRKLFDCDFGRRHEACSCGQR